MYHSRICRAGILLLSTLLLITAVLVPVTANGLPSEFTAFPLTGQAPLDVQFTNVTTDGDAHHSWDFGDGWFYFLPNPLHQYDTAGNYTVTHTVANFTSSNYTTKVNYIQVTNPPPVSDFSGLPLTGPAPLPVDFNSTSVGVVFDYQWDFGDGGTSTESDPHYIYNEAGVYNVSLTVSNDGGSNTRTKNAYVTVLNPVPVASFSANITAGEAPHHVLFTDTSSGTGITHWSWIFGDGETSIESNPVHVYENPGLFSVTLTVENDGGANTTTRNEYIRVFDDIPLADFIANPTSGLKPLTVQFHDISLGDPTTFLWDFGDGKQSTMQSPSHTYENTGNYTVSLTVGTSGGTNTTVKGDFIRVSQEFEVPVANFTTDYFYYGRFYAYGGLQDTSTGNPTSWNWSFGDGHYSDYQNPWHEFEGVGSYNVTLTVSNPAGSDSITKEAFVVIPTPAPEADFYVAPRDRYGSFPLTVLFQDYSEGSIDWDTPPATYEWNFGDGSPNSTERGPVYHHYMEAGTYTVTLTVTDIGGTDTLTRVDYIGETTPPQPIADFTATPKRGYAPLTVDFIAQSTGSPALSYAWAFGDGTVSTEKDPTHVFSTPGLYNITHVTTNTGGSDSITKPGYIEVLPTPPGVYAEFTATPKSGTTPLSVEFIDQSGGGILSWDWSFGDGASSSDKNPTHIFTSPGSYNISLTVTGTDGSSTEEKTGYIVVNEEIPLIAEFTSNVTTGTVPLTVQFLDASEGNPSSWFWYFESGYYYILNEVAESGVIPPYGNHISAEKNPVVTYNSPGNYTVMLTVSRSGETDTIEKVDYIQVTPPPPVADFYAYNNEGPAPLEVEFDAYGPYYWYIDNWTWDFGDGTGETTTSAWIVHTYQNPGLYNVTLSVTSPYGSDISTQVNCVNVTQVMPPVPSFDAVPKSGNAPLSVTFTDTSSGTVTSRFWDFGDGTTEWANATPVVTHLYSLPRTYTVSLTVGNNGGQATTIQTDYIQVNPSGTPPRAWFTASPLMGYEPLTVRFTDRSSGTPSSWYWDFGDGNSSSDRNPVHTYATAGRYIPTLTVSNSGGSDSHSSFVWVRAQFVLHPYNPSPTITVKPTIPSIPGSSPISFFAVDKNFGSAPMTILFTDRSINSPTSWSWEFGDGEISSVRNPTHTYTIPGTYTVKLTVENAKGSSSSSRKIYVR